MKNLVFKNDKIKRKRTDFQLLLIKRENFSFIQEMNWQDTDWENTCKACI